MSLNSSDAQTLSMVAAYLKEIRDQLKQMNQTLQKLVPPETEAKPLSPPPPAPRA